MDINYKKIGKNYSGMVFPLPDHSHLVALTRLEFVQRQCVAPDIAFGVKRDHASKTLGLQPWRHRRICSYAIASLQVAATVTSAINLKEMCMKVLLEVEITIN